MSMYGNYYRPALKSSVDIQLQNAFSDGNWSTVVRLADKRAKSHNDPYYEVVKACAESRLDGPLEKCTALILMDSFVRNGSVLKDAEALELLEWACRDHRGSFSYSDTLGVLRTRWVKANPRSPAAPQSLRACLQNWDLVNAQQIAATLDKSLTSSSNRHYMFWSIVLTYMLSTSDQCPREKQKIYGLLALKQLERAAELTESNPTENGANDDGKGMDRGLRTDEEVIFYYRVLAAHSSPDDFLKRMRSPNLGALKQFDEGRKHLLHEALRVFEAHGQWEAVYEFCLHALSRKEEDGSPSLLAADWTVLRGIIAAASQMPNQHEAIEQVKSLLSSFVSAVKSSKVSPMYTKNIGLALIELAFRAPESVTSLPIGSPVGATSRTLQLALFLEQHAHEISAFDDVKGYFEQLTFEEARYLVDDVIMKRISRESSHVAALYVKLRYLLTTCPQTLTHVPSTEVNSKKAPKLRCKYCSGIETAAECQGCLRLIAGLAMDLFAENEKKKDTDAAKEIERDPNVDLSLVAAMCLLKLSGFRPGPSRHPRLHKLRKSFLLQAVLILDAQLQKTPNHPPLRLLLAQLYLLLGCASYAQQIWAPLGVKRTIHDALSPLFFDRISSISPGLFAGLRPVMEPLRSYYAYSLKDPSPVKIWDAFDSGSYSSVLEVTEYCDRLRRSSTLVMTVVEERRAARALGGRLEDLEEISFLDMVEISDDTDFVATLDYGSVPNFESSLSPRIVESLSIGPPPSNTRSHLALLSEEFLQLCAFTPSKDYKPAKPNEAADADLVFVTETLASLHEAFTNFMHLPDTTSRLSPAEESYYSILTLLSAILSCGMTTARHDGLSPAFGNAATSLKAALSSMQGALGPPAHSQTPDGRDTATHLDLFHQLSDPHSMAMLREAAVAVKVGASLLLTHHETQSARDRTGKSGLHKDVVSEMKTLSKLGSHILGELKDRVKELKSELGEPGWLDRVVDWTFGYDLAVNDADISGSVLNTVGGRAAVEEWAGKLIDSWREGSKGWNMVKME